MTLDTQRLRSDTPGCARQHFFDAAGAALMPQPVLDVMHRHIDLEARLGGYRAAEVRQDDIDAAYEAIAALLGCAPRNIAFVENATVGFALTLGAVDPGPGDLIMTTANDYVSSHMAFLSLKQRRGVEIALLPESEEGGFDVERARQSVAAARPCLVTVTHVPTGSGLIQDTEALAGVCADLGIPLLVDGCQSLGQLNLNLGASGCAVFTASTRKFLRGPRGVGIMFVADEWLERGLAPMHPDLHGGEWIAADRYLLREDARRFENWEFNYAALLGAGAAAEYALSLGMDAIEADLMQRGAALREALKTLDGVDVMDRGSRQGAIVTVRVEGSDPQRLREHLLVSRIAHSLSTAGSNRYDYAAKDIDWTVRFSPHVYNDATDTEALLAALASRPT